LNHRTVQEAGRAVVAWYEGEDVDSEDWHHRHVSCQQCGIMMNSSLQHIDKKSNRCCVDCIMLTANRSSDLARIRAAMKMLSLDMSALAKEIGGSARILDAWMSGDDLSSQKVKKVGDLVLNWFETVANSRKAFKTDEERFAVSMMQSTQQRLLFLSMCCNELFIIIPHCWHDT
jgi:hypothetical protein